MKFINLQELFFTTAGAFMCSASVSDLVFYWAESWKKDAVLFIVSFIFLFIGYMLSRTKEGQNE